MINKKSTKDYLKKSDEQIIVHRGTYDEISEILKNQEFRGNNMNDKIKEFIGNNVIFGHNVMVLTGKHMYKSNLWNVKPEGNDIHIGDNTWICSGIIIVGG